VNILLTLLPKVIGSLFMRLLSEKLLEELILWGLKKLAASTKTRVDDELYAMAEKQLKKPSN